MNRSFININALYNYQKKEKEQKRAKVSGSKIIDKIFQNLKDNPVKLKSKKLRSCPDGKVRNPKSNRCIKKK